MTPERKAAREKQLSRGNDPKSTASSLEEKMDHGYYRTGLYYRRWLEMRLKKVNGCKL